MERERERAKNGGRVDPSAYILRKRVRGEWDRASARERIQYLIGSVHKDPLRCAVRLVAPGSSASTAVVLPTSTVSSHIRTISIAEGFETRHTMPLVTV